MQLQVSLPAAPESVSAARRVAEKALEGSGSPKVAAKLLLMISELVTNSLRHAGLSGEDSVGLAVDATPSVIRVEVSDPGPGFDAVHPKHPDVDVGSGWGLYIVERLASRWGVVRGRPSFVWFEIDA